MPPPAQTGRRRWPWVLAVATLLLALCCAGGGIGLFNYLTNDSASTPAEAIGLYFRAAEKQDSTQMRAALCESQRSNATNEVARFADREQGGAQVQDIQWRIENEGGEGGNHIVNVLVTVDYFASGSIYAKSYHLSLRVVEEAGWRVCGISA